MNIYSAFSAERMEERPLGDSDWWSYDSIIWMDNVIFSPVPTCVLILPSNINLRLSYSSGFRAPQAFDEDMHIENVGGTVAMIERAKDLKEEKIPKVSVLLQICIIVSEHSRRIC